MMRRTSFNPGRGWLVLIPPTPWGRARSTAMVMLCLLVGCVARTVESSVDSGRGGTEDSKREIRYLALGDSYTIGEGVEPAERWPEQLAVLLRERGLAVGEPEIVARTGWTTHELGAGIGRANPSGTYGLVSLLIGVNNQYRGRDLEEYRTQFRDLLGRATGLAGGDAGRVVVLSIPDWGVTPFAEGRDRARITAEIERFNAAAREETERRGARWVAITPQSREAARDPAMLAPDRLHPSGKMYAAWARLALPDALAALGRGEQ